MKKAQKIASLTTYGGFLVIVLGGVISTVFSIRGFISLSKGEEKDYFFNNLNQPRKLGFSILLRDLQIERYSVREEWLLVFLGEQKISLKFPAQAGVFYHCERAGYDFRIIGRSEDKEKSALWVEVKEPSGGKKEVWIPTKQFQAQTDLLKDVSFLYYGASNSPIQSVKGALEILERGKIISTQTVEINHPLHYKGTLFYLADFNPGDSTQTQLGVVKAKGMGVIYVGFIVFCLGLFSLFYLNPYFLPKVNNERVRVIG